MPMADWLALLGADRTECRVFVADGTLSLFSGVPVLSAAIEMTPAPNRLCRGKKYAAMGAADQLGDGLGARPRYVKETFGQHEDQ